MSLQGGRRIRTSCVMPCEEDGIGLPIDGVGRKVSPDNKLIGVGKDKVNVPTKFQCFYREPFTMDWLQLGDNEGLNVGEQLTTEQANVALTAALILTLQFAVIYTVPQMPWDIVTENYGEEFARNAHDWAINFMLIAVVFTGLGMSAALGVLLGFNELDGPCEMMSFLELYGSKKASAGFLLMMCGAVITCFDTCFSVFVCEYELRNALIGTVIVVTTFSVINFDVFGPLFQSLYTVKRMSLQHPPIVLQVSEIRDLMKAFFQQVGEEYLSEPLLIRFIMDKKAAETTSMPNQGIKYHRSIANITQKRIEALVNEHIESLIQIEIPQQQSGKHRTSSLSD